MSKYRMEISDEALQAFEKELGTKELSESAKIAITATCLPLFALGYSSAQKEAQKAATQEAERQESSAKLAEMLDYPAQWDTAAYPNVESAAIESLHTANVAAASFEKALQERNAESNGYTMNQMREYSAGVLATRAYVIVDALETKISDYNKTAAHLLSQGHGMAASAYSLTAIELRTIADNAKTIGSKPFQKRAMYWAKKCFGEFLANSKEERNERFVEEALELVQSCGMTKRAVLGAVDYVYNRPVGEKRQEVGGTYTTLALLCAANGIDMVGEGERDLLEIDNEETSTRIRLKRQGKPDFDSVKIKTLTKQHFIDSLDKDSSPSLTYSDGTLSASGEMVYALVLKALHS